MGSSFTLTLANLFMSEWQKKLVEEQRQANYMADDANTWHPNIKLDYKINKSLPFLDLLLTNNNGTLATSVYHKPAAEPYITPFTSDHPRHVFANIIKTSLEHATRYSSTFEEFNNERRDVKLMLLYNGYPSTFIENEFTKYFFEHKSTSPFLQYIDQEKNYIHMRQKLLGQPTFRQSQVALSAAQANKDNDLGENPINQPEKTFLILEKNYSYIIHTKEDSIHVSVICIKYTKTSFNEHQQWIHT
ncbi:unnamed protein product [Rotaria socialis]|uniref:Helix-turn-helix domain-containing protein n=4 Tax=Rotaria socialis TaxID=392032 RepID=A0A818MV67_9BILA|nr:unnamed protein product [Rotaria socialis]CAF4563042.1 unnamed protein product [Rotaria socialis]CAF4942970.1 unnamed protein product [Rotaria socialis]